MNNLENPLAEADRASVDVIAPWPNPRLPDCPCPAAEELRRAMEQLPVGYHELDANGVVVFVNRFELNMFGYTNDQVVGHCIWQFMAHGDIGYSRQALLDKLSGREPDAPYLRDFITGCGRTLTCELRDKLLRNEQGLVTGISSCVIDVTDRVQADAVLADRLRWASAVFHSLSDAVVVIDTLGMVRSLNEAAERLLGCAASQLTGTGLRESLRMADPLLSAMDVSDFLEHLQTQHAALITMIGNDGELRNLSLRTSPLVDEGGCILGIVAILREES